jgi:hypothetical protein
MVFGKGACADTIAMIHRLERYREEAAAAVSCHWHQRRIGVG